MLSQLFSASLQIIIIIIISIFFIKKFNKEIFQNLLLVTFFYLIMALLLVIPIKYNAFNFTNTNWNFSGKIYAILFSIIFFSIFKQRFKNQNYLKIKPEKKLLKHVFIVFGILILFGFLDGIIFGSPKNLDEEKLLYQFFMPSIDEELAYRGILLSLFSTIVINNIKVIYLKINPSILITALLFAIMHGLKVSENLEITFYSYITCKTFIYGCFWAWITIKTKSILYAMLFHTYSNVMPMFIHSFLNN